jgi:hypothetical protein
VNDLLLVIAILAPLAALVPEVVEVPGPPGTWRTVAPVVGAAAWLLVLLGGPHASIGPLRPGAVAAAAGVATALLAAAADLMVERAEGEGPPRPAILAASIVGLGLAVGDTAGPSGLALAVSLLAGCAVLANRRGGMPAGAEGSLLLVAAGGAAIAVAGMVILNGRTGTFSIGPDPLAGLLPGALAIAAAAVMVTASARPGLDASVLTAGALALGVEASATLPDSGGAWVLAIVLGAIAVALLGAPRSGRVPQWPLLPGVAASAGVVALAAAAVPSGGAASAAALIAAGAVLGLVTGGRAAPLFAVPGGVALAYALALEGGVPAAVVGGLVLLAAALIADLIARRAMHIDGPVFVAADVRPVHIAAAVLGAWLAIAPGSWAWAGASGLGAYDDGAAIMAATGMLVAVATGARRGPGLAARWYDLVAAPADPTPVGASPRP